MKKSHCAHEPHLVIRHFNIPPGGEWMLLRAGWSVILVSEGTGYCLQPDSNRMVETGTVLLVPNNAPGVIRASHLNRFSLYVFSVVPRRLSGLLSLNEQAFFEAAAYRRKLSVQVFPPGHPIVAAMNELCAHRNQVRVSFRLKLLQLFLEAFGRDLDQPAFTGTAPDARERLRGFLKETPLSELLEMSFDEIAQRTHCTSRHLSRIFRELVGVTFTEKRAELRLARARELLTTSDSKIVDVALESGYRSLSLFNLMFSRRFGTSPSKWRQKYGSRPGRGTRAGSAGLTPTPLLP